MNYLAADDAPAQYRHGLSLLHGWLPLTLQIVAIVVLALALGWRNRRWRLVWLPVSVAVGLAVAAWAHWYVDSQGLAGDPAPDSLWIWTGISGFAISALILGWRGIKWRRVAAVAAVPLCLLGTGLALNSWVGYFPTVQIAWNQLTAGPLPDETDAATVAALQKAGTVQNHGSVVPVDIPSTASGFKHRQELVYLPPRWFASNPPPKLPVVMMIGGEFNTPADWLRTGNAAAIVDTFANAHGGNAPVLVFVDSGGSFNNDTECVDGVRGNVADHLTKDVVPFVNATYGTSTAGADWGVVGWSMGGTCAVDLAVMHPELFSSFVDIAGDTGPNAGTKDQTIARLYGGDAAAWARFDPTTVIAKHGPYQGVSGWFAISTDKPKPRPAGMNPGADAVGLGGRDANGMQSDQTEAANALCGLGRANGITCSVVPTTGRHDWPLATNVFTAALPWLAGAIHTPGVPAIPLPTGAPVPAPPPAPQGR
ncbi:alpha/beta hydrolase [Mycolicibacterium sp. 050158]|uniref:alpha/beta hydrolase n=1 Tax=Mycolicibacterium sp. 050158 TaxID=3090602 RepID=UPI00299D8729|nr:alpha/beta hydrolase-fold protein [Mycolicibacterium sp. 050158]MDX1892298.1 alpha/beta hydrolase-fold protein [Mycolicibacterium sp. 050158]